MVGIFINTPGLELDMFRRTMDMDKDVWYIILSAMFLLNFMFVSGGGGVDLPASRGRGVPSPSY